MGLEAEPATSDRMAFADRGKMLLGHHVTHASRRPTVAGIILVIGGTIAVIVGQLFTRLDGTPRIEPNVTPHNPRFTIRFAAVIEEPSRMPLDTAIDINELIADKNVGVAFVQFDHPMATVMSSSFVALSGALYLSCEVSGFRCWCIDPERANAVFHRRIRQIRFTHATNLVIGRFADKVGLITF